MTHFPELYAPELKTAQRLARQAGALLLNFYAQGVKVEQKIAEDLYREPVTEADRASNTFIVNGLAEAFPNDGILAEESADTAARLIKERVWMVDPVDGTSGFIDRDDDFAVQIGLAVNGAVVLGVVYQPVTNTLYWAVIGAGTWLEQDNAPPRRLRVGNEADISNMVLAVSRSHRSPRMDTILRVCRFKSEVQRGSVGIKIGLIAEQSAHVYIHLSPRTKQWDTCAPEIILREAGGNLTDLFGHRLRYNTREVQNLNGLLASNGAWHAGLVRELRPLLEKFGRAPREIS